MNSGPIGFFDSGIGGISVLGRAIKMLPKENFIYYGDDLNIPYGEKDACCIKKLTNDAVAKLVDMGIKALVVACNTATSVAIKDLRAKYDIPIIGIEPALKVAVQGEDKGSIIVMATPRTIKEEKFNSLYNEYKDKMNIIPLPAAGLVQLIESGKIYDVEIVEYLNNLYSHVHRPIGYIVLGCTHYIFVKSILEKLYPDANIVDGGEGAVRHLKNILTERDLLNNYGDSSVQVVFTKEDSIGQKYFDYYLNYIMGNI